MSNGCCHLWNPVSACLYALKRARPIGQQIKIELKPIILMVSRNRYVQRRAVDGNCRSFLGAEPNCQAISWPLLKVGMGSGMFGFLVPNHVCPIPPGRRHRTPLITGREALHRSGNVSLGVQCQFPGGIRHMWFGTRNPNTPELIARAAPWRLQVKQ